MSRKTRINLKVLLPEVPDTRDGCVERLLTLVRKLPGIKGAHVVREGSGTELCLHYDPSLTSIAEVQRLATVAGVEITERFGHGVFPLHAIAGEDAGRRFEAALQSQPGVLSASVNLPAQVARIEWDNSLTSKSVLECDIADLGIRGGPKRAVGCCARNHDPGGEEGHDHGNGEPKGFYARNKEMVWSLSGGALLLAAWLGESYMGLPRAAAIGLYAVSYGFGGWDLVSHWIKSIVKGRFTFDIDLLMLLAAIGAAVLGNWTEGAFLLFLFSLAHALEHYAMDRARNAISALSELTPDVAIVRRDGKEAELPIEEVVEGDIVVVRPGERIPVDGKVQSGTSAVNQAPITGESVPVSKSAGEPVFAGTVNGDGALEIVTEKASGDRTLDRVIQMVEEAQTQKAPTEQFVERFSRVFVPIVLVADVLMIVAPPMLGLLPWNVSFYRGMALLVAASPCALALGTPSAVLAAIAQAARQGVLVKGGAHLENLGNVKAMAFDKTGTLTVGKPEVTEVAPAKGVEASELLSIAAAVEKRSQHPLAEAVVRKAEADNITILEEVGELSSVNGRGIRSSVSGKTVEIGSLRLWDDVPEEIRREGDRLAASGNSIMAVRFDGRWLGVIGVADQPREGVRETLDALRALGVKPLVMLTGDNKGVADAIGKQVGVDEVRSELLPEDKVTAVRDLLNAHKLVAMSGDGVNDAPALANATVGIAMGGAGTAVALETADVALMGDDLAKLPFAVGLARAASGVIRQNLYVSLLVIGILVIATTAGFIRIGPAVVFHEGSTLVVLANSLRLLGFKGILIKEA